MNLKYSVHFPVKVELGRSENELGRSKNELLRTRPCKQMGLLMSDHNSSLTRPRYVQLVRSTVLVRSIAGRGGRYGILNKFKVLEHPSRPRSSELDQCVPNSTVSSP